ncbi:MAG: OmpA family protein [Magnetospirillum sp. WYHS-4]
MAPGLDDEDFERLPKVEQEKVWLLTFTDTVCLMLTFFVMLFSMSHVQADKWKEIADSLSQSLSPIKPENAKIPTVAFNIGTIFRRQAVNLDYLGSVLAETASRDPLLAGVQFVRQEERLVVALPSELLFESGRAIMTEKAREAVFALGGLLRNVGNTIGVGGHSESQGSPGQEYSSAWELSLGRAAAVANALRRVGYPHDIVAYGYSDSRSQDLAGLPEAQRQALARRVDIVILSTAGTD